MEADIQRCRNNKFLLALDDLGAGYAGLSSLISLRPNFARLDASLVKDIDRDARRANLIRGRPAAAPEPPNPEVLALIERRL